ncbi:MAG: hypothetical protein KZQ83_07285 [gamma proteobacterium symbiont of Taylorina sp.]|nr:hypothetical protein [gamma proteobacterium symbiont of Taylorina sp.]
MKQFNKSNYIYTPLFCEENIWHLAQSLIDDGIKSNNIHILFLTNKMMQIAIFNQLSAGLEEPVIWDYHVILMAKFDHTDFIFDFDSRLEFPCTLEDYFKKSLPTNINIDYTSKLRVIPSSIYLQRFDSDRSHMLGIIPQAQFPDYPAIISMAENKIKLLNLFNSNNEIENTYELNPRYSTGTF